MSFAIVLRDLTNGFYHWAIWDIPAAIMSLPADLPAGRTLDGGFMQDSFMGTQGQFTGPCPAGSLHVYQFEIFALPTTTLTFNMGGGGEAVVQAAYAAASKAAIGTALLTGRSNARHY
jgi:phosphatidylethanolamine-binding protein (PEBP) family uncharacterized protein